MSVIDLKEFMVERTSYADKLEIEPQTLQLIESTVSEVIDPKLLTSIGPETCDADIDDDIKCGVCKRVPVEPVMDESCE